MPKHTSTVDAAVGQLDALQAERVRLSDMAERATVQRDAAIAERHSAFMAGGDVAALDLRMVTLAADARDVATALANNASAIAAAERAVTLARAADAEHAQRAALEDMAAAQRAVMTLVTGELAALVTRAMDARMAANTAESERARLLGEVPHRAQLPLSVARAGTLVDALQTVADRPHLGERVLAWGV